MPELSSVLLCHTYLSGNYIRANDERRALRRAASQASEHTDEDQRARDTLQAAETNLRVQAALLRPFVAALGSGAQPGLKRHAFDFFKGETNLFVWADTYRTSVAHPCKHTPSLSNILRAGLAGAGAGFIPGAVVGAIIGIVTQLTTGLLALLTLGGIHAGVHVGLFIMLAATAACALSLGAVAMWAASQVIAARAAHDTETSRFWEDVSGGIALVPRVIVALAFEPSRVLSFLESMKRREFGQTDEHA